MDAHLKLRSDLSIIGSIADFSYKWSMNVGLTPMDAARLTLAIDELTTDIVRFGYPEEPGDIEFFFHKNLSHVEVTITELGEPFEPERYPYNVEHALATNNFEGAGLEIVRHMVDDFVFINKGRGGKEFRLTKNISAAHIADMVPAEELKAAPVAPEDDGYVLTPLLPEDTEDVAKLIYWTYGYSYMKEALYHPKQTALALERGEKFGVLVRTTSGEPVGYFAVLRTTDSNIGEVGEAVVSPKHRKKGIMLMMLDALLVTARERGLLGIFGEAVTGHTISQRVNAKFGFYSTALMLEAFPRVKYKMFKEISDQDISVLIEYVPLVRGLPQTVYLPERYAPLLTTIYKHLELPIEPRTAFNQTLPETSKITARFNYEFMQGTLVVKHFGADFLEQVELQLQPESERPLNVVYLDLPLDDPATPQFVDALRAKGFIFSGLMPRFHHERDYLRLQKLYKVPDFSWIKVLTPLAAQLKAFIAEEIG